MNALFANIAEFIIVIYAAKAIGDEFQYKTNTTLFAGATTRMGILVTKLSSIILTAVFLAFISGGISIVAMNVIQTAVSVVEMIQLFGKVFLIYVAYSFCIGTYTLYLTIRTKSTLTGMVATLASFWLGQTLLDVLVSKVPSSIDIVRVIPMYNASRALQFHEYGMLELSGILVFGLVCVVLTNKYLKKADIA